MSVPVRQPHLGGLPLFGLKALLLHSGKHAAVEHARGCGTHHAVLHNKGQSRWQHLSSQSTFVACSTGVQAYNPKPQARGQVALTMMAWTQ